MCLIGACLSLVDNLSEDPICFGLAAGQGHRCCPSSPMPRAAVGCGLEGEAGILSSCTVAIKEDMDPSPHHLNSPENCLPEASKYIELLLGKKEVFTYGF